MKIIKKYILLFLVVFNFNNGYFSQDAAATIPYFQAIVTSINKMDESQKALMIQEYSESVNHTATLAKILDNANEMKKLYETLQIESLKELYRLYQGYVCVAHEYEFLMSLNDRGDCVIDFEVDMALLKYNASKEVFGALGIANGIYKMSQGEQLKSFKDGVDLLKESFQELNAVNTKLRLSVLNQINNLSGPTKMSYQLDIAKEQLFQPAELSILGVNRATPLGIDNTVYEEPDEELIESSQANKLNEYSKSEYKRTERKWYMSIFDWVVWAGMFLGFFYAVSGYTFNTPDKMYRIVYLGIGIVLTSLYLFLTN